jgi:hypothetical protein
LLLATDRHLDISKVLKGDQPVDVIPARECTSGANTMRFNAADQLIRDPV